MLTLVGGFHHYVEALKDVPIAPPSASGGSGLQVNGAAVNVGRVASAPGLTPLYRGAAGQATIYLGATAVASKYLGPQTLF